MNNIQSYNILSKYYKYIYNHQISNELSLNNYLEYILSNVISNNRFLDIGCGTGIFTEKLYRNFNINYGIDPCKDMLEQVDFNSNIKYLNLYLSEFNVTNFDLITSFSQVMIYIVL